jgi:hypothetical protein
MTNSNHQIPKWLKQIMENSWELELLISGGAIFSLFQLSGSWVNWIESTNEFTFFLGRSAILLIGTLGLELLKIGFITHIILRAIWLSMVCVNYAYPQGVNKENIKWKKPFKIPVSHEENLQVSIIRVDRYCGIVIYLSISSTIFLIGLILTIFLLLSVPSILEWKYAYGLYMNFVVLSLILYVMDLISAGLFRKTPVLSYLVFPIFSVLDVLTLRKFIEKSGFHFFSNIPKVKFFTVAFTMLSFGLILSYLNTYRDLHWKNIFDKRGYTMQLTNGMDVGPMFYRDEPVSRYRGNPSIQSKIVHDSYLNLFIPYNIHADNLLNGLGKEKQNILVSDIASVSIDSVETREIQWHASWKDSQNGISRHIGIESFIPIGHLEDGPHILKVYTDPSLAKKIEQNIELSDFDRERLSGLEILFIKDTEVSIEK